MTQTMTERFHLTGQIKVGVGDQSLIGDGYWPEPGHDQDLVNYGDKR